MFYFVHAIVSASSIVNILNFAIVINNSGICHLYLDKFDAVKIKLLKKTLLKQLGNCLKTTASVKFPENFYPKFETIQVHHNFYFVAE